MKTPRFWQSRGLISTALLPLSALYRIGATLDRQRTKPQHAPLPVISIGNTTAGGTGKTPTTIHLAKMLRSMGETPHIITRGYGGTEKGPTLVAPTDDWQRVGDEALLLADAAPTWVSRDRLAGARAAHAAGATVILCDDALQHHRLHKDFSLLVMAADYGVGNARLLPAGPLRESWPRAFLNRVDAILLIGDPNTPPKPALLHHLQRLGPIHVAQLLPTLNTAKLLDKKNWIAFAGIAHPDKFFCTLRDLKLNVINTMKYADHFAYRRDDWLGMLEYAYRFNAHLITTAKDAVKIPPDLRDQFTVLPVALILADEAALQSQLAAMLAEWRTLHRG